MRIQPAKGLTIVMQSMPATMPAEISWTIAATHSIVCLAESVAASSYGTVNLPFLIVGVRLVAHATPCLHLFAGKRVCDSSTSAFLKPLARRNICQRGWVHPSRSQRGGPPPKRPGTGAPAGRIAPRNLQQQRAPSVAGGAPCILTKAQDA